VFGIIYIMNKKLRRTISKSKSQKKMRKHLKSSSQKDLLQIAIGNKTFVSKNGIICLDNNEFFKKGDWNEC
jgi:hypothetical protein